MLLQEIIAPAIHDCMVFSPSDSNILVCGHICFLTVQNISARSRSDLTGAYDIIRSVCMSSDGRLACSLCGKATVYCHDIFNDNILLWKHSEGTFKLNGSLVYHDKFNAFIVAGQKSATCMLDANTGHVVARLSSPTWGTRIFLVRLRKFGLLVLQASQCAI